MRINKTYFLIFGLIFLIIVVLVLQFLLGSKKELANKFPETTPQSKQQEGFTILSKTLTNDPIGVTDDFIITFSEPITYDTIDYSIEPEIHLSLILDDTGVNLTVRPTQIWDFEKNYKLIIKQGTTSLSGNSLGKDVVIEFKTKGYHGE